jgi:regulator of nonsense transcripts 1
LYEAYYIIGIIQEMFQKQIASYQIGVITPYAGQNELILNIIEKEFPEEAEDLLVSSIDGFQGKEKDYILMSTVRSNHNHQLGFFSDPNRLNVALTRAKIGMIIVGNRQTFEENQHWKAFFEYLNSIRAIYKIPTKKKVNETDSLNFPSSDDSEGDDFFGE